MKMRIEGADRAELDEAEQLVRRFLVVGEVSGDYRNRRRKHGADRVPGVRRYLDFELPGPVDLTPAPAMMFGYVQGSGVKASRAQVAIARKFLDDAAADGRPVAVAAIELAREILDHEHDVEPATARVCRGAICLDEPCVFRTAGECTR